MRIIKWAFIGGVTIFVLYHFWPTQIKQTGRVASDKAYRAGRELVK